LLGDSRKENTSLKNGIKLEREWEEHRGGESEGLLQMARAAKGGTIIGAGEGGGSCTLHLFQFQCLVFSMY